MQYGNGGGQAGMSIASGTAMPPPQFNPNQVNEQKRNTVAEELEGHGKRLSDLHQVIGGLEQRLTTILRSPAPIGESGSQPVQTASLVVNALREMQLTTDYAIARLQDLMNRLEL